MPGVYLGEKELIMFRPPKNVSEPPPPPAPPAPPFTGNDGNWSGWGGQITSLPYTYLATLTLE